MSFLKRACMAVTRRTSRTIIMFIIFLAIANLILTGISIQNATENAKVLARQKLGSKITLSFDSEAAMKNAREEMKNSEDSEDKKGAGLASITYEAITEEMVQQILENKHITSYNYVVNTNAYASSFEAITDETEENIKDAEQKTQDQIDDAKQQASNANNKINKFNKNQEAMGEMDGPGGNRGGGQKLNLNINFDIDMANIVSPDLTVIGVSDYTLDEKFSNSDYVLVEGEGITANLETENAVLIEESLAEVNEIKVGDTIKITASNGGEKISLTVVGIYKAENLTSSNISGMGVSLDYNRLYVKYDTALNIKETSAEETKDSDAMFRGVTNSSDGIDEVVFKVDDPANVDEVLEFAKTTTIDFTKFKLDANTEEYEQMIEPLENVASFATILVAIVAVAGALIIMLILMLWIKERTYETGILLSLGESKLKIVLQYAIEVLIIAILAFTLSIFTGNIISEKVGDVLLEKELNTINEEKQNQPDIGGRFEMEEQNNTEVISNIDVSVNFEVIMKLYGIGILIVLVSSITPTILVFRYKPKKILSNI